MQRKGILLSMIVLFAFLLTFAQGTALASSGQRTAIAGHAIHMANNPTLSSCYVRIVYLHGRNGATTSACKVKEKPAKAIPFIAQYPCGDRLPTPWVSLYQDAWYGGAQICFVGPGSVNLTNYWINGNTSWNDQTSSFNIGANGYMSIDINGNGNHCNFWYGDETYYINNACGSGWNDNASYVNIYN
ncbi:MAG TPA: hypothetical protein VKR42_11510 [Ktedonobacteraceae bacterium]|nr:hypothetical protein [Ktedonobacteraceae bacterium]